MAMTADSSSSHHSPRASGFSGDGLNSCSQFLPKNLPSPWNQVVRGEPESISVVNHSSSSPSSSSSSKQTSFSDCPPPKAVASLVGDSSVVVESSDGNNNNRTKKSAWNKPSNGVVEVSPVMGAVSWPALSESTRASHKSSADFSTKTVPDGSVSNSQGPVIPTAPQKQATTNVNPNSTPNRSMPARQRPGKRSGGGGGNSSGGVPAQSGFTQPPPPPPPPPFPVFPMPPNSYAGFVPVMPDPSPREPPYRGKNWEARPIGGFVSHSQPYTVNDHRNSSRRGNYGPRGDGPYHNNYGGRRDRDVHVQQPRAPPRGFVRPPPPNAAPFVPSSPVRPFGNPMGFPELLYIPTLPMEPYRGVPFITHAPPPAMILPAPEPPISALLVHQIDYYFSDANLIKDEFLKSNMDDQGWVPISLIASFPRVKNLTINIQLILDSLRVSSVVEIQDDKVRRRNEWMKWIPSYSQVSSESGLPSLGESSSDMLATSFQKITVEELPSNMAVKAEDAPGRHSSELTGEPQLSNGEGTEDTCSNRN